jgi:membrane protease YdiL (CAAX protease family)
MMPMRSVRGLLAAIWLVGGIGAFLFAQYKHIPPAIAVPVALAFLVELSLYFPMERATRWPPWLLFASALAPHLIYSVPTGVFHPSLVIVTAGLIAVAVTLPQMQPRAPAIEYGYLVFMAAIYLAKLVRRAYPEPLDGLEVDILGNLMWVRLGIAGLLRNHSAESIGFGFLPRRSEWLTGIKHFLMFLPFGLALGLILKIGGFGLVNGFWYKAPGTFLAILWTVALAEEVFFRGILQPRFSRWLGLWPGLIVTSVIFGLVHLWFANRFPNWKQVAVATVLGLFCGRAFLEAKAIRASIVTHAFAVAAWRTLFS